MKVLIRSDLKLHNSDPNWASKMEKILGTWQEVETDYLFANQYNLTNGLRVHDYQINAVEDDARIKRRYKCVWCGKVSDSLCQLSDHPKVAEYNNGTLVVEKNGKEYVKAEDFHRVSFFTRKAIGLAEEFITFKEEEFVLNSWHISFKGDIIRLVSHKYNYPTIIELRATTDGYILDNDMGFGVIAKPPRSTARVFRNHGIPKYLLTKLKGIITGEIKGAN